MEVRELTAAAVREAPPPARARGDRRVAALGRLVLATTVAALAGSVVLDVITPEAARAATESGPGWEIGLSGLFLAVPGALLLSRAPRNAVSWVVAGSALFWALDGLASSWLTYAVWQDPPLPGASLSFWFVQRFGAWLLLGLPLLLLLYPDGRLPRGRWRTVSLVSIGCAAALPALVLVTPAEILEQRAVAPLPDVFRGLELDPTSLPLPEHLVLPLVHLAWPLSAVGILLPLTVVVHRLRAASGEARRRMRWLLWAGVVDALVMLAALLFPTTAVSIDLALAVGLTGLAVTVGILRPGAVDIDRLLGGTLVYGGLAAGVVLLDLLVLGAAGVLLDDRFDERNALLVTLLVVAAVYVPLRAALWRIVRRWVLGEREDPYRVVAGLAERLERSDGTDEQLMAVAAAVAEAFRSRYVGVEVTSGTGERVLAEHGARPAEVQSLPIAYRGEDIGRLLLPRSGVRAQLLTRDERLLADVVRQAAAAARAGSLAAQLQAGREQLVAAREEERRRLRRDLHDGLGPCLGAVVLRIDTARNLAASRPEEADRVLRQARDDVAAALTDVRRLVHDLRPPALDDLGLAGAVRQQAERILPPHLAVTVTAEETGDLPAAVEVAAYRITSEALANVARHARASRLHVALGRADGALVVTVTDDGCGIAPDAPAGSGWCRCASGRRSWADRARSSARPTAERWCGRSCPPPEGARTMAEPDEGPLRVLVVDDHPVYRDGLAMLLGSVPGLAVVGTAADGAEAVRCARQEQPDVVVMDVQMPGMDGIAATRAITSESPSVGVVVLTMSEDDGTVFSAVRAGARGYLLKGADQEEVVRAITTVAGGGAVFGAALARRIAEFFAAGPAGPATAFPQLTAREREVLDLVAAGRSNAQIAAALFLSPKTVRNNVSNVLTKLQVTDRAQAIVRGRDAGLGR